MGAIRTNGSKTLSKEGAKIASLGELSSQYPIKSVIDRNGATCRNNNHFERPTILNAPRDAHSMVQTGELLQTHKQTNKQMDTTKSIISPASRSII